MATSGAHPAVDLIIAVHSVERPIARAVRSVLDGSGGEVRVTVVCHDLSVTAVAGVLGDLAQDARLRLIEHRDGIRSPSGPFNAGLDAAEAEWLAIMGSDDELEPGAIAAWLARARESGSAAVLPRIVRRGERDVVVATPPVRVGRRERLDGVRDRLSYRSAPLGLLHRDLVGDLRFGGALPQGEDVLFSARLWFAGRPVALAPGPAYLVHDDARDRVTMAPRPVAVSLAFIEEVLADRWFTGAPPAVRFALAAKLLRINVLGEFVNRPAAAEWTPDERDDLARHVRGIVDVAPSVLDVFPVADRRLLEALPYDSGVDAERLLALARARRAFGHPRTLLTRSLRHLLHREAPLRFMSASWSAARSARAAR